MIFFNNTAWEANRSFTRCCLRIMAMSLTLCLLVLSSSFSVLAATTIIGTTNGSFESDLTGAVTQGDVTVVSSFGMLLPTEGSHALLMTTEPDSGATPADAHISLLRIENFTVPLEYSHIRLDYDLFTNEPLPSRTNDRFTVELTLLTSAGTRTLLTSDTFDHFYPTVYSTYAAHTGLRSISADVSGEAAGAESLTLELRIADVGDGRNDSAVFIDNIRLVEPGIPQARTNINFIQIDTNEEVNFDGSGSSDDGSIVSYEWDFANGTGGFGPNVSALFPDEGVYQGTLTVTDDEGNSDTAAFTVAVGDSGRAPSIVSSPRFTARKGLKYIYEVEAVDPEIPFGDTLTFSLPQAPEGMGIDPTTGRISWVPVDGTPETNPVTVRVEDSFGLSDEQNFAVTLDPSSFMIMTDDIGRIYYARSNGDGTWSNYRWINDLPGLIRGVTIADFDNDGDWDFLVPANPSGNLIEFHLFSNDGTDQFEQLGSVASSGANSGRPYGMTSGDYNHDGNMDFLASRSGTHVIKGLGDGKGGFSISEFNTSLGNGRGTDTADFDHDGHLDFVRARYSTGQIHLWRGDGLGGFTNAGHVGDSGTDPYAVAAADFDNDGHPDYIANYGSNGNTYFYKGHGDGTFNSYVYVSSIDFNNHGKFDNYDFNGDGNQDLITVSYSSKKIRYYPGNGDGTFGSAVQVNPSNTNDNILGVSAPPGPPSMGDPVARITPDYIVAEPGATLAFSGVSSSDDGSIVSYAWDFGGGVIASGDAAIHTFPSDEGDYVVKLTVQDDSGRVSVGTALVRILGDDPLANAGGPYVFGEEFASKGTYTVTLDGSGSTDDGATLLKFAWDLGNPLGGPFHSDYLDPLLWQSSGASLDGAGSALVVGSGSWGNRYLYTKGHYARRAGDSYRTQIRFRSGTHYAMWGLKSTNNDYNYPQLQHAFYFYNDGVLRVREHGANVAVVGNYSVNVSYDLRIDIKDPGATFYIRETGAATWTELYDSTYPGSPQYRVGALVYSGTVELTDFETRDGFSADSQPTIHYQGVGVYDVTLKVTDGVGQENIDSTTVTIQAGDLPVADTGGPYVLTEANANCGQWTANFNGTGSTDDHSIYRYEWDFGDGQTSSSISPTHTYAASGTYNVTLTVWDHALQVGSASTTVTTTFQNLPVAGPGGPYSVDESAARAGLWTSTFSAAGSSDDSGICDYSWDFGDGSTGTGATPSHQYAGTGIYGVTLTVRDHALQSHTASTSISVTANDTPVSVPGGPYAVDESNVEAGKWTSTFDGSNSSDDYGIWTYEWDFGDGATLTQTPISENFSTGILDGSRWISSGVTVVGEEAVVTGSGSWGPRYLVSSQVFTRRAGDSYTGQVLAEADGRMMWGLKDTGTNYSYTQFYYAIYFTNNKIYIYESGKQMGAPGVFSDDVSYDVRIDVKSRGATYYFRETGSSDWIVLRDSNHSTAGSFRLGATVHSGVIHLDNFEGPSSALTQHVYSAAGTYDVTLKVTDNGGQTHETITQVVVGSNSPPIADAGATHITEVGAPVTLDASGSTDDFGIFAYEWDFYTPEEFLGGFLSASLDATVWRSSGATVADGEAVLTGAGSWTNRYVFSEEVFARDTGRSFTGLVRVVEGSGNKYAMWGVKDTGTNYSYTQLYYALYFRNGEIRVYESGSHKGTFSTYSNDVDYEVRIDVKAGKGASYFVREAGSPNWTLIRNTSHSTASSFRLGMTVHSGEFHFDDLMTTVDFPNQSVTASVSYGRPGTYQPEVTVTDHALQTDTDSTTVTVVEGLPPEADTGGPYLTNEAIPTRFNARGSSDDFGIEWYEWVFGDGDTHKSRNPFVDHVYTTAGSYTVSLVVTDYSGKSASETSTVTVSADPVVAAVPWAFSGGVEVPHDTWSGKQLMLKAVAWSNRTPLTYEWNFGDGSASVSGTVSNAYKIQAKHTYSGIEGQPFVATLTVTDADGVTASDNYLVRIRAKSLDVETNIAIDDGLWYLHGAQSRSSSGGIIFGSWTYGGYIAHATASAAQAFLINGHGELGDVRENPYVETVSRGLHTTFTRLRKVSISPQTYGDPDSNGNGFGLEVNSSRPIYEGGPVMDTIASTVTPEIYADSGGSGVVNRTYREIARDMLDQYAWGQYNSASVGGGWRYSWNQAPDNSAAQWAAIGVLALKQNFDLDFPQWVKDRNEVWLEYSFGGSGFGYSGRGASQAQTPSGMIQMVMNGAERDHPFWVSSENSFTKNWDSWYYGSNDYYSLLALTKTMRLALPEPVVTLTGTGTYDGLDWFSDPTRGVARTLINDAFASSNGSFAGSGRRVNQPTRTAWGVIMLTRALFVQPPIADAGSDRVWGVDAPITLDGSGSFHLDPFKNIVSYEWDLDGDGVFDTSSSEPTVTYTYSDADYPIATLPQNVKVTLRVADNNDPQVFDLDTMVVTIAVPPHPPFADAGGPYQATAGIAFELDGSGSGDIDPTDFITSWEWDLDNDREYDDATGESPDFVYATPGVYNVGLRVQDDSVLNDLDGDGVRDPEERLDDFDFSTVVVSPNNPPEADAGGPYVGDEGTLITLDGGNSIDPDGNPLSFSWDLDGDGVADVVGSTPSFPAVDDGVFTVALEVSDTLLLGNDSAQVTVNNVAPTLAATPGLLILDDPTDVSVDFTDPGVLDTHTATIDWGEGAGPEAAAGITQGAGSGTITSSHIYAVDGIYTATITVTDDDGGADSASFQINVDRNDPPVADAGGPYDVNEGSFIQVSAEDSYDPNLGDLLTYEWDLDGNGTFETVGTTVTFDASALDGPQTLTISVRVTDGDGAWDIATAQVNVLNLPPIVDEGGPFVVVEGSSVEVTGAASDPGGDVLSFSWDLDGDGIFETLGLTADFSALGLDGPETLEVQLQVVDDDGAATVVSMMVTIENLPPTANAGGPYTVLEGSSVSVSGSGTDPGNDPLTYAWDLDGDGVFETNGQNAIFSALDIDGPDTRTIALRVSDDDGASTITTTTVTIENVAPTADAGGPYTVLEGGSVGVSGAGTDVGNDELTYDWDLDGDGVFETSGQNVTFSALGLDGPDTRTIALRVSDDDGASTIATTIITIENVAPTADAGGPYSVPEGGSVGVSGSGTDPGGDSLSYAWDLDGDGVFEVVGSNATFSALGLDGPDTRTIYFQVTDDDGASTVDSVVVTIENIAPTASVGGPYTVDEGGTVAVAGSATDPGGDALVYTWDLDGDGVFDDAVGVSPSFDATLLDDSVVSIAVRATDTSGLSSTASTTVTVLNVTPIADAGSDQTIDEGDTASFLGSFSDAGTLDTHTIEWDYGDGSPTESGTLSPTHTYADNGSYTVVLTVTDDDGGVSTDMLIVTVNNLPPVLGQVNGPIDPTPLEQSVTVDAAFTDAGVLDTHTVDIDWGDGSSSVGTVSETDGSGTVEGSHTYTTAGVYTVTMMVTDKDGGSDSGQYQYVVVYDDGAGFVTGGGWIESPLGAYADGPTLSGRANFGFVSKYKKGAHVPVGSTEFQFKLADLNFHSNSYDWLVVAGSRAQYKGVGTINGDGNYGFFVVGIDGSKTGGDSVDKFRIKIWDKDNGDAIVYDNKMGESLDSNDATDIQAGSIVVHTKK